MAVKWRGYLTTGVIDKIALKSGLKNCFSSEEIPELLVEPARVFVMAGFSQKSLEVWNQVRTHVVLPEECKPIQYDLASGTYQLLGSFSGSPIRFEGGIQVNLLQSPDGSSVTINPSEGGQTGRSLPGEIPLAGETVPADRDFLDGGLSCDRVIRRINGLPGPDINLSAGDGVIVENYREFSRIVVNVSGTSLDSCPELEGSSDPVDCVPVRTPECGATGSAQDKVCPPGVPDSLGGYVGYTRPVTPVSPPVSPKSPEPDFGPDVSGYCKFRREGGQWMLIESHLGENYTCDPPRFAGVEGQEVQVRGVPYPADPIWIVRNPFFADEQFWKFVGASIVLNDFNGLNVVHAQNGGQVSQAAIPVKAGWYKVQFTSPLGAASVQVKLISDRGDVLLNTGAVQLDDNTYHTVFAKLPTGAVTLALEATSGEFKVTGVAVVPQH